MDDVFIREVCMPLSLRAFTLLDMNGDYNVFVNPDLSEESKIKALDHEKKHIENGDFYSNETAANLEDVLEKLCF